MYESEGLDVAADGKAWQWGVASMLAVVLALPLLPLAIAARGIELLRGGLGGEGSS